ncbi:MAG TPA: hypothetical protein VI997_00915 [Candidatus Thermoplasmatota archaeon]|nr:hypothetical protein [Candidatus Thermoplasmatota archaeon]
MAKTLLVAGTVVVAATLVAAAILLPTLAPPQAPVAAASAPPVSYAAPAVFEDPAGDATDTGAGWATRVAGCVAGYFVLGKCLDAPTAVPEVGTPGPWFDIVGLAFEGETAEELTFSMSVAELNDWSDAMGPDGVHRMAWYVVCWAPDEESGCSRSASVTAMVHDGHPMLEGYTESYSDECNEWSWCSFTIPVDVQLGAPAKLTFRVPKAYAAADGAPLGAHHMAAYTGWYEETEAFPMWHAGVTMHTPARHIHDHTGGVGVFSITDMTDGQPLELEFVEPASARVAAADAPLLASPPGMTHAGGSSYDSAAFDLVAFDMHEEGSDLVVEFVVAQLQGEPERDFDYAVAIGVARGNVWEIGYRHEGGETYGYAGRCIMEECQDGAVTYVEGRILPGSPGIVEVHVPLELLGNPGPGTQTDLLWAATMASDRDTYWGEYGGPVYGDVHSVFMVDSMIGGAPYVFGSGHRASGPVDDGHEH